jgi:signal transduction histidine kinase
VALAVAGGAGVALYLLGWAISVEPEAAGVGVAPREPGGRRGLAFGLIVLGALLLLRSLGLWLGDAVGWPLVLTAFGTAVLWARSDPSDRARWNRAGAALATNPVDTLVGGRAALARTIVGALLVAAGVATFLATRYTLVAVGRALLAMAVAAAGLGLILGPWMYRLAQQLAEERRERIRSEERAEVAAHLHDSVLHTLALIQRGDAPPEIVTLARRQERELRAWLYGPQLPGGDLREAVEAVAATVERDHNVAVDVVVVGDAALDERVHALVRAIQEATVNAARHSGARRVSLFVEAEPDGIDAFVRDEGKGFDPEHVPADRGGIAGSIRGRMRRHGGSAEIASEPGEGTEVHLHLPREAT